MNLVGNLINAVPADLAALSLRTLSLELNENLNSLGPTSLSSELAVRVFPLLTFAIGLPAKIWGKLNHNRTVSLFGTNVSSLGALNDAATVDRAYLGYNFSYVPLCTTQDSEEVPLTFPD